MQYSFKKLNLIVGWLSFVLASTVYLLTMEPTASFWDCSEFIATSYKLEVGHPPGAPLFMMISRFFTMFGGPGQAAVLVNSMSALASGATVMFLFWTITHLARRAMRKSGDELTLPQTIAVLGAGLIGAGAYTFTDTFWFSAVEGEVYALSSMFTALVFWAILKWENVADEPHANRWIVLIAYLTGLAIGVHLLNLLIIPPIALIYYFRKYPRVTKWGVVKSLLVSAAVLIFVMKFIIAGTVNLGAFFDRMFVNGLGLPVNSGITFFALALLAALGWGVYWTHKRGKVLANTILLCTAVIIVGYGSYASVIIRSAANPPMNSNAPSNPYGLLSLLNRDQYGARPLFKGPYYSSPVAGIKESTVYYEDEGKYKAAKTVTAREYDPRFEFFFPRMYSDKESDIKAYKNWVDIEGRQIPYDDETVTVPTFAENLKFFFAYQLNFMYWRYFLWNFVGRQSDIQSTGEITDGNWLSGIDAVDRIFLGPQDNLPQEQASNKGRNTYYFLPFILGIIGLIYQLNRDGRNFSVVMAFFIMTGIAIAVYLNSPPAEPRERDYVFAGSVYAFAMWIGFGVPALYEAFKRWFKKDGAATAVAATLIGAVVPTILAAQNWDDHDRSHRYVARDFGENYLNSTLPNAIIMNYGDNDTFPLWYAQEVEGVRKDVRVMNMSYLGAEWYIDQMRIKSNDSDPLPFSLPRSKYTYRNETVLIQELFNRPIPAKQLIEWIASEDPRTMLPMTSGEKMDFLPSRQIAIPVNKQNAIESGIVKPEDAHLMVDTVYLNINPNKHYLTRDELMLIDLLANFDWKRPIYFTQFSSPASLGLKDYLQLDGFAYRFVPIRTPSTPAKKTSDYLKVGRIDSEYLYDKLMNQFRYGNIDDPRVYADHTIQTNFRATFTRGLYAQLADQLLAEGDTTRAVEVLDSVVRRIPFSQIRHDYLTTIPLIESYYKAGAFDKGNAILEDYAQNLEQYIDHYLRFTGKTKELVEPQLYDNLQNLLELHQTAADFGQQEQIERLDQYFQSIGLTDQ